MTSRSMAMPTAPETRKASGTRDEQRQRRTGRARSVRIDLLHHEGRVGADHHHLAMRHVDDAHHAEGDGEADGGEQQHGAERQAVPDVLQRLPQGELRVDGAIALLAAARTASIAASSGATVEQRRQQAERILVAAQLAARRWPRAAGRPWRPAWWPGWRRGPRSSARLDAGSVSLASAASTPASAVGVVRREHGVRRRRGACAGSAASEVERAAGGLRACERTALLSRTFFRLAASTPSALAPVLASNSAPAASL